MKILGKVLAKMMSLHMAGTVVTKLPWGIEQLSRFRGKVNSLRINVESAEMLMYRINRLEAHDSLTSGVECCGVIYCLLGFSVHRILRGWLSTVYC